MNDLPTRMERTILAEQTPTLAYFILNYWMDSQVKAQIENSQALQQHLRLESKRLVHKGV